MNLKRSLHPFLLVLLAFSSLSADAQSVAQPDPLFMTIQSLDTKLFDAYNHCDLTTLGAMVSDDLECERRVQLRAKKIQISVPSGDGDRDTEFAVVRSLLFSLF